MDEIHAIAYQCGQTFAVTLLKTWPLLTVSGSILSVLTIVLLLREIRRLRAQHKAKKAFFDWYEQRLNATEIVVDESQARRLYAARQSNRLIIESQVASEVINK